jgi:predicted outer membrane protein
MIQPLIIITLFSACKSISYESAVLSNEDKFYGVKEDNALLLVELKDLSQLAEDLSGLAEEKAYIKDVYDLGQSAIKDHKKLQTQLAILAFKKRAKLPSSVKKENQEIYRSIHKITDRKSFDIVYLDNMEETLQKMADLSDKFLEDSQDTQMRNFITKHSGVIKSELKRIETIQDYMGKPNPEITSRDQ